MTPKFHQQILNAIRNLLDCASNQTINSFLINLCILVRQDVDHRIEDPAGVSTSVIRKEIKTLMKLSNLQGIAENLDIFEEIDTARSIASSDTDGDVPLSKEDIEKDSKDNHPWWWDAF